MEYNKKRRWWIDYKTYIFGAFNLIFPITQLIFVLFETTSMKERVLYVVILLLFSLFISLIIGFLYGEHKKEKNNKKRYFKYNQTNLIVEYGDIFQEKGIILIPMDSEFDIDCHPNIIPEKSIQSIFVNKVKSKELTSDLSDKIKKYHDNKNDDTKLGFRYDCGNEKYLLFPVITLDKENVAKIEFKDYLNRIVLLCESINTNAKKNTVIVPIVGSGISILNANINSFDRLRIMLRIMEVYNFNRELSIKIIINEKHKLDFKLSEL